MLIKLLSAIPALLLITIPVSAIDYPHNSTNNIGCDSCHYIYGTQPSLLPPWTAHTPQDIDDTQFNTLCWSCHNDVDAPYMRTHSSLQIDDGYGDWTIECKTCHEPHYQKQFRTYGSASYLYSGASTGLTAATITKTGAGWTVDAYQGLVVIPNVSQKNYSYKILSNTEDTLTVQGPINLTKVSVGNTFAIVYGKLINNSIDLSKITITPAKSGIKTVRFFNSTGTNSFADGNATYDGICEVCHTQTKYHKNNGTGTSHNAGTNCITCHKHENGFAHGGGGGSGNCAECHGTTGSHAPHLNISGVSCDRCHDTSNMPYFKTGTDINGDGRYNLSETDVCYSCHHDGTYVSTGVRVNVSPKASWGTSIGCGGCHKYGPDYTDGSPKANTHATHKAYTCDNCHSATTTTNNTITNQANHLNNAYNLQAKSGVSFTYTYSAQGGTCSSVSCHNDTDAQWGSTACLNCHSISQGNRADIDDQFAANSHHVQGIDVENLHCYQCHWEANYDGRINTAYHRGSAVSGAAVDLVIYGTKSRPSGYVSGSTAIAYTANGSRSEINKITSHCLGCHSDKNNTAEPFGDCNMPSKYAWDVTSIDARYSNTGTTVWGKYTTLANTAKKNLTKAYSAHGNAINNAGGFDPSNGLDGTITNTRAGSVNVQCFDCHNSHGSNAAGVTSSYISLNGNQNGGILKNTQAGKGGYSVTYTPAESTDTTYKNPYKAGGDLCFDCHSEANAVSTPWGYNATFGASQPIKGYADRTRFGTGEAGRDARFAYRQGRTNKGGHFMASSSLQNAPDYQINGLCTPCHDPHGVSPSLAGEMAYSVPLLKGTWMTSPYKEDQPTDRNHNYQGKSPNYRLDRNTFSTGGHINEDDTLFAGLCLRCHPKSKLTDGTKKNTTWKSRDRIHETVKGWGNNAEHNFPCSKCHAPHNSSLPRLMQTNCLDYKHSGWVVSGGTAPSSSGRGKYYSGSGRFPEGRMIPGCHDNPNPGAWPDNQYWNNVTPW